jgi:hypothetical protein
MTGRWYVNLFAGWYYMKPITNGCALRDFTASKPGGLATP